MDNSARGGSKFAGVRVVTQTQKLIFRYGRAFGNHNKYLTRRYHPIFGRPAFNVTIQITLNYPVRKGGLGYTAGFPGHYFRLRVGPVTYWSLEVHT